jgi:glutaredoxin
MYTIYGKPNCTSCKAAQMLLTSKGHTFKYLSMGEDYDLTEYVSVAPPGFRSFPLILIGDVVIGSFQDLNNALENKE